MSAVQTNLILSLILLAAFLWAIWPAAAAAILSHPFLQMRRESFTLTRPQPNVRVILVGRPW